MSSHGSRFVSGLVLAAGGSQRLGQPKQLLPYRSRPLLAHVIATARACRFDQLLCVLGGAADAIRERVDLGGVQVVENRNFGAGCSSSIAAAVHAIDPRSERLVLLLGDQPAVDADTVSALLDGAGDAALAACAYEDGRGHPLAFHRSTFPALADLHGDKAVWKLLHRAGPAVVDVPVAAPVPRDVDTWEDYEALLSA